jgi:arginyl-tRNA synthetase
LIEKALIPHVLISSTSTAPNGFINIFISRESIVTNFKQLLLQGTKNVCRVEPRKVLVDFSSPNIAKEMHVGHLRSTIIGDAICRILEFCGHDVDRVNHVGDWGTQFGMLITYLQDAYPDILVNPPNISDLTLIYKASKKRFDDEPEFKERARTNVVNLQRGDVACRAIWILLCEISRKEFQKVYDILNVRVKEVGESFYNPMIPSMITELQQKGFIIEDEGMLIVRLAHFEIPLIARKSDGGYGYDSTDLTAIRYRLHDLHRDWIIYVTDEGQGNHFHMCFDVAKAVGWTTSSTDKTAVSSRLDHIGFGVVCGDDGKRLKTRSAEGNVRLIDLLDEARSRMFIALEERSKEGKNSLSKEDVENAAKVIGYGAVKYFDLKQHPSTNYIFNFDRMLDTKGDTAVYLLFAYARLTSILTKAEELKGISINALIEKTFSSSDFSNLDLQHPAEKSLIFELFQFGDMIRSVLNELLPNRVCDYLKEISVKFTDFITRCHVLNAKEDGPDAEMTMASRLLLCEATRRVMETCFNLLGIDTLTRI